MTVKRKAILLMFVLIVPAGAAAIAAKATRYPRRFAVVEPDRLLRGGMPDGEHIRNLWLDHRIGTVVSLTTKTNRTGDMAAREMIDKLRLRHKRFPLPGDGCGPYETIDAAADALAEENATPVFFHCAAGKQRSNVVLAAYRIKHDGYSLDEALKELDTYDLDRSEETKLIDHLKGYAEWLQRVTADDAETQQPAFDPQP